MSETKSKIMKTLNGRSVYDEGAARIYTLKDGETIDDAPEDADIVWDPENEGEGAGEGTGGGTVDLTEVHERIDALEDEIADLGGTLTEPAEDDIPKVFFGGALQQTKDEAVVPFSYRSKTLSFDCYAEIKAQGNSTMSWPKKNQTVKLYADADCTKKLKIDFKGWGKQNKFVIKANWRDLTHVRDIVSVRLEGDCLRSNPDYDTFPELLKTSPNMGGIDGFPVVVYAAGVYQGRYMWNIPKDKWMTNMDDELDEHCILCSEDYNSSCFRKAANINGSDWTDEIHDVVPASIKTRWNEVISFVMNSSDEEFKANLDSYIKVSTLIDRHLMGLLSCDFDGYGKNQLYITYDGQQWYADRYDKDGTWGNYWTGNAMLSSNYGRDQYEDMILNRPGNLLFIRLEKLFWERLQSRWAELRVNELSIPNIINRFRELYDITPPYLIEEDYASTTANGAFTGIPNKTTCTIQQIQKFVVERYAWTDAYVAGLTGGGTEPDEPEITLVSISATYSGGDVDVGTELSALTGIVVVGTYSDGSTSAITGYTLSGEIMEGVNTITVAYQGKTATFTVTGVADEEEPANTTVLAENFSANGEKFEYTVNDIDFAAGDYIEVSMDVSNCVNTNENVLSIGEGIDTYNAGKKLHFYYTANDKWLRCVNRTVGANQQFGCCSTTGTVKITVKNDGMYVDDVLKESFAQYDATVNSLTSLSIGSTEGTTRSNAYYHYIVVVKTQPTQIPCTGITLDKTTLSFADTGSQTIVATVTPTDTTDKVVWSSDNESVATVENGVVTAIADGSCTITATCGNYSASCAVNVSGVRDGSVLYTLAEERTFNGTTDYIDTGIQLFDTDKDFTITFNITPNAQTATQPTVIGSIDETNMGYPGISFFGYNSVYHLGGAGNVVSSGIATTDTNTYSCALIHEAGSGKCSLKMCRRGHVTECSCNIANATHTKNLLIGCFLNSDGALDGFWSGVMHSLTVWSRVLSDEEIYEYLGAEENTMFHDYYIDVASSGNTGVKLYTEDIDFTIVYDAVLAATPTGATYFITNQNTVSGHVHPTHGFLGQYFGQFVAIGDADPYAGVRYKFVFTHTKGTNTLNYYLRYINDSAGADTVYTQTVTGTFAANTSVVTLNGSDIVPTVDEFAIYNYAMTEDEARAWLADKPTTIPCTGITLDKSTLTFTGAGTQTLTATVTPDGCTDVVTWESDNSSIATVIDGVVTAVANGSATITATCGEYSASCIVSVYGIEVYTALTYIESSGTQYIDTGISGGTNAAWEIQMNSLTTAATKWEQYFAGVSPSLIPNLGDSTPNATPSKQGISSSCITKDSNRLCAKEDAVHTFRYDGTNVVYVDGTAVTPLVNDPTGNGWGDLTWYVFNSHGEPTLQSTMCLYYLKMWTDGVLVRDFIPVKRNADNVLCLFDKVTNTFFENIGTGTFTGGGTEPDEPTEIPCTGITLDKTMLSFTNTGSQTIVATVTPADTTDKVVWSSDAQSVATVSNGVVTPISNGECTITAKCGSYSAVCSVTVSCFVNILHGVGWNVGYIRGATNKGEIMTEGVYTDVYTDAFDVSALSHIYVVPAAKSLNNMRIVFWTDSAASGKTTCVGATDGINSVGIWSVDCDIPDGALYARLSISNKANNEGELTGVTIRQTADGEIIGELAYP